jgi:uncharacterized protein (TIGR03435 family)
MGGLSRGNPLHCKTIVGTFLVFTGLLLGQQAAPASNPANWPKAFDVVSIKPFDMRQPLRWEGVTAEAGGRLTAIASAEQLIAFAFNIDPYQTVGLPNWAEKKLYSVDAVSPAGAPSLSRRQNIEMERPMVLALLQQYFRMEFHRSTKPREVLALVVAKGGAKLKRSDDDETAALQAAGPDSTLHATNMSAGRYSSVAGQMFELAGSLSFDLQKLVIDETGLTGYYDFKLTWKPGPGESLPGGPRAEGPSIYSALQSQLGLRLKSTKEPVNVIAIDHIETPAESN